MTLLAPPQPTKRGPSKKVVLKHVRDTVRYFDHQVDGVRKLRQWKNFLLFDEQGLGKSLSALTLAAIAIEQQGAKRILVVAPATLKGNWADEAGEHCIYDVRVLPSKGTPAKRLKLLAEFDGDILVVNYEQVIRHVDDLNAMGFDIVIYDEAHYLKNHQSARWKAASALTVPRRWLLTGSPMLNQVNDLWSLMNLVAPKTFPSYWKFLNRYVVFGVKTIGRKQVGTDELGEPIYETITRKEQVGLKNEAELRAKIEKYSLRREKKDCLDLPAKQIIPVRLDMHPEQAKVYQQAQTELMIEMPNGADPLELNNALTKMLRLKQIAGTTATIEGFPDHSSKLDRAVEMLDEFVLQQKEPVVVFTQFRKVLECLAERLDLHHGGSIPWLALHGDIPVDERKPLVNEWTNAAKLGKPMAMLCMVQVAGVGLTMTAASKCIFLDKLYAPKMNEQAQDRLHRIGQTGTVQVYELIMRGTIEQRIEQILNRKTAAFNAVIANQDTGWKAQLLSAIKQNEKVQQEGDAA